MIARHGQETVSQKPAPSSLLPGFQHLIPSAAAAPLAAHIRPLFLPDLVQQIARNKQIDANRREQAHPAFRKWAKDLKQGVLQQLHETQGEQDFNHVLLRGLGYTTQSDVASDQPWTLTPKSNVPGSGEVDAALGKFRLDESGRLSGEPLVMVELKGAKVDLDRKMLTRNITPVQQVWNYLNASESAQWAIVCNYAEIRLYSRQKSSNHLHRVFLTELDDPDKFAEFYAIFHADSLLGTGMFAQKTGWLLRETGERQEKVSVELYREYAERRVELIQELRAKGVTELGPGDRGGPAPAGPHPVHRLRRGSGLASRPKPAQSHGLRAGRRPDGVTGAMPKPGQVRRQVWCPRNTGVKLAM